MSSSEAAHPEHGPPFLAHHFANVHQQAHAVRLGMWIFLATEVLLFGGLFVAYAGYRFLFIETFRAGSHHLNLVMGGVNTVILITSSLTVALGLRATIEGKPRQTVRLLAFTIACALGFLVIKAFEYHHHIEVGAVPGSGFRVAEMQGLPGASIFFALYFFSTGLHALHVIVGMIVLSWVLLRTSQGRFSPAYYTPVELGGLYWHLVDLIWIFLFPLLYLI
jgi:cytochrome c oxidase subunit III